MKSVCLALLVCMVSMLALAEVNVTLAPSGTSDFGNQPIGFQALTPFLLANSGSSAITITGIAVEPANGPYSIYHDQYTSCPSQGMLSAGADCEIVVGFTASAVGPVSGKLVVNYVVQNSHVTLNANLMANGVNDVTIVAAPIPCNYHIQYFFSPLPCTVTLLNQEPTTLMSISEEVEPSGPGDFSIWSTTCGSSLSVLTSCTIAIAYWGGHDLEEGVLQVTSNSPDHRTIKFRLQGCSRGLC
ncbi:MAG: choice-of-anchor D domain-containing protein [Candidatus Korobacteraceae bacterium]